MASQAINSDFPALPQSFFCRPAEVVGPELVGCRLVKRQIDGSVLWGVIVETEAYSQDEPACHGYRRRSPQNETLFGAPGRFYVYVSYGIHHCVNVVTGRPEWANGVLLRAVAMPEEPERVAAGPGLLARRFGLDRSDDSCPVTGEHEVWMAPRVATFTNPPLVTTTRIGISQGELLPLRWYLKSSRSVSRRVKGDRTPPVDRSWFPLPEPNG
ncbi:DNA-3-methyladenine glycosylase [Synechococcus sp. MIT S1220]|uniref:DNA-3-methyladenine glycosylase n=1 Tax=Synechococcus sp. MIT S1220 TaxID=3082549 RepID=UPI0039B0C138